MTTSENEKPAAVALPPLHPIVQTPVEVSKLTFEQKLESIGWVIVIGHVVRWAVDALYYITTQVSYFTRAKNGQLVTVIGSNPPGDWWDRLPVHLRNITGWNPFGIVNNGQLAPLWFVTVRHDTRYVVIGILTGVVVFFLFAKPRKFRYEYGALRVAITPALALVYAIPGVALGGLVIYQLPWLVRHGFAVPDRFGPLAAEVNGYIASGHLALFILGLAGSWCFAKYASLGPADEIQWFFAERKAASLMTENKSLVGSVASKIPVIGTPGYRLRVRALVAAGAPCKDRGTWMVVVAVTGVVLLTILAGYGAWLTLAGPAAAA